LLACSVGDIQTSDFITNPKNFIPLCRFLRATGLEHTKNLYFDRNPAVTLGCFTNGTIAQVVTNSLSPLSRQHLYDGSRVTV